MPLFCTPALRSYKLTRYVHVWCPLVWLSLPTAKQLFPAATEEPFCTKYKLVKWHTKSQHAAEQTCTDTLQSERTHHTQTFTELYRKRVQNIHSQQHTHKKETKTAKITSHSLDRYTHLWCTGLASLVQHAQHFWFYPIHQKNTLMTAYLW